MNEIPRRMYEIRTRTRAGFGSHQSTGMVRVVKPVDIVMYQKLVKHERSIKAMQNIMSDHCLKEDRGLEIV